MMCITTTDLPVPLIHDPCDLYLLSSHLDVLLGLSDTPRISEKHESLSAFTPLAHGTPLFLLESFSLTLFLSISFSWGVHTTICETELEKERDQERRKIRDRKRDKKKEKTRYNVKTQKWRSDADESGWMHRVPLPDTCRKDIKQRHTMISYLHTCFSLTAGDRPTHMIFIISLKN